MKKTNDQATGPEGKSPSSLPSKATGSSAVRKPGSSAQPKPVQESSITERVPEYAQDTESVTEAIHFNGGKPFRPDAVDTEMEESPTESVGAGLDARTADISRDDTEEVFVILPEDAAETSQLPVVESEVVEERPWEASPSTTAVLKGMPQVTGGTSPIAASAPTSIEDVPLVKMNPMATAASETETVSPSGSDPITGLVRTAESTLQKQGGEEELGAIEEIAGIADLDREEPIEENIDGTTKLDLLPETEQSTTASGHKGSRVARILVAASALAALIIVGVFFSSDIGKLYFGFFGGGSPSDSGSGAQAQALSPVAPVPTIPVDPDAAAQEALASTRSDLRSKILLAVQVGLRAEAGKD